MTVGVMRSLHVRRCTLVVVRFGTNWKSKQLVLFTLLAHNTDQSIRAETVSMRRLCAEGPLPIRALDNTVWRGDLLKLQLPERMQQNAAVDVDCPEDDLGSRSKISANQVKFA